jgi:hypothetical protein
MSQDGSCELSYLPVAPVRARVIVDKFGLKDLGAGAPVDAEILGQEAGDVLPAAIRHEARLGKLAHVGVDEGDAGLALAPAVE